LGGFGDGGVDREETGLFPEQYRRADNAMTMSLLLVDRLGQHLGLDEQTRKAEGVGKVAQWTRKAVRRENVLQYAHVA
jgi:hypothetical protein